MVAVQHVAERAATEVPGTLSERRMVGRSLPSVAVRTRGRGVLLQVVVGAGWPAPLADLAAQVRDRVAARTTQMTGLPVLEVDVDVVVLSRPTLRRP